MPDTAAWIRQLESDLKGAKAGRAGQQNKIAAIEDSRGKVPPQWKTELANYDYSITDYTNKIKAMKERQTLLQKIDKAAFPSPQYEALKKSLAANTATFAKLSFKEADLPAPKKRPKA